MKKILLVPVFLVILACNTLLGTPTLVPTGTPPPPPTDTPPAPTVPGTATDTPATATPAPSFVTVRLYSRDGDLPTQLAAEAQKAAALGLIPVVEFDADW